MEVTRLGIFVILFSLVLATHPPSGKFKVRIYPFGNPRGQCCQWKGTSPATCVIKCKYFFRICANATDTYHSGQMSCIVTKPNKGNRTVETSFPFYSHWTGNVNLMIEAWYGFPNFTLGRRTAFSPFNSARLMIQMHDQHYIAAGNRWQRKSYVSPRAKLDYGIKVSCEPHYDRPFCIRHPGSLENEEEDDEFGFDFHELEERIYDMLDSRTFGLDIFQIGGEIGSAVESFGSVVNSLFAFSSFLNGLKFIGDFVLSYI